MPALEPYWGKPAVRNLRGDDGNVGIIRSPLRAIVLPDQVSRGLGDEVSLPGPWLGCRGALTRAAARNRPSARGGDSCRVNQSRPRAHAAVDSASVLLSRALPEGRSSHSCCRSMWVANGAPG